MAFWDVVAEHHVRQAVAEYDRLGQVEFLAHYGFGRATAYLLIVDGKAYDSKAILGVAYRLATGSPWVRMISAAGSMGPLACCADWALTSGTSVTGSGQTLPC